MMSGEVRERLKRTDCKFVASGLVGSNPTFSKSFMDIDNVQNDRLQAAEGRGCKPVLCPPILRKLMNLTPREKEVFNHLLTGELLRVIASKLKLSTKTIEVHASKIYKKLGVPNRIELLIKFRKNMGNIEIKSLIDILKDSLKECTNVDEKLNKIIDLVVNQTKLVDHIVSSLPEDIQTEIFSKCGFKGFIN